MRTKKYFLLLAFIAMVHALFGTNVVATKLDFQPMGSSYYINDQVYVSLKAVDDLNNLDGTISGTATISAPGIDMNFNTITLSNGVGAGYIRFVAPGNNVQLTAVLNNLTGTSTNFIVLAYNWKAVFEPLPSTNVFLSSSDIMNGAFVDVFRLKIKDLGFDNKSTRFSKITLQIAHSNIDRLSNVFKQGKVFLVNEQNFTELSHDGFYIHDNNIEIYFNGEGMVIPDNNTIEFCIKLMFDTGVNLDGTQFQFKIDKSLSGTFTHDNSFSSYFESPLANDYLGNTYEVKITATKLAFLAQPTSSIVGQNLMPIVVSAVDNNNFTDADAAGNIELEATNIAGTISRPLTNGAAIFTGIHFTAVEYNKTLVAKLGTQFSTTSQTFNIIPLTVNVTSTVENTAQPPGADITMQLSPNSQNPTLIKILSMKVTDKGGDNKPTKITRLVLTTGPQNTLQFGMQGQAIVGGGLNFADGTPLVFNGDQVQMTPTQIILFFDPTNPAYNAIIPDGESKVIDLFLAFSNQIPDHTKIQFQIVAQNHEWEAVGMNQSSLFESSFAGGNIAGNVYNVEYVASKLIFTQQPITANTGQTMNIEVAAVNNFNCVDADFTGNITLSGVNGLNGANPVAAQNGIAAFPAISFSTPGIDNQLTASASNLANAVSNKFNIIGVGQKALIISTNEPLYENKLWDANINLTLQNNEFIQNFSNTYLQISYNSGVLNKNISLKQVNIYDSKHASVGINYDGTDITTDITDFSITVLKDGLTVPDADMVSNKLTIHAVQEDIELRQEIVMTEINLNGYALLVAARDNYFNIPLETTNFELINAPTGLSISKVEFYVENGKPNSGGVVLTFAFDGTDFDVNITDFKIKVKAPATPKNTEYLSNSMVIQAIVEPVMDFSAIEPPVIQVGNAVNDITGQLSDPNGTPLMIPVFKFKITDNGTNDGKPTIVTKILLKTGPQNTMAMDEALTGGGLFFVNPDNSEEQIIFNGNQVLLGPDKIEIPFDPLTTNFVIPNGTSREILVKLAVNKFAGDNKVLQMQLDQAHGMTAAGGGMSSLFPASLANAIVGNQFKINIVANNWIFTKQPVTSMVNTTMPEIILQAQNSYGLVDEDINGSVTLTKTGYTIAGNTASAINGVVKFLAIMFNATGVDLQLTATGSSITGLSDKFNIVNAPAAVISSVSPLEEYKVHVQSVDVDLIGGVLYEANPVITDFTVTGLDNSGVTLKSLTRISDTKVKLYFASDYRDISVDMPFTVTVTNAAITLDGSLTTGTIVLHYTTETARLATETLFSEDNLDKNYLYFLLDNSLFKDQTLDKSNFVLVNIPAPLVGKIYISEVQYAAESRIAKIILGYDGTDFDQNIDNVYVKVLAAETVKDKDITSSNAISITAISEPLPTVTTADVADYSDAAADFAGVITSQNPEIITEAGFVLSGIGGYNAGYIFGTDFYLHKTGLTANVVYEYYAYAYSPKSGYSVVPTTKKSFRTLQIEPSGNANISNTQKTSSSVTLTWNYSKSDVSGYVVVAKNSTGAYADILDRITYSEDLDWSNGNALKKVTTNTVTFTGLQASTAYSFRIYPYSLNADNVPNYKVTTVDIDVTTETTTSVGDNFNTTIMVYPNPFIEYISLYNVSSINKIMMVNSMGQVVMEYANNYAESAQLNVGNLANGLYTLILIDKNGKQSIQKLIK